MLDKYVSKDVNTSRLALTQHPLQPRYWERWLGWKTLERLISERAVKELCVPNPLSITEWGELPLQLQPSKEKVEKTYQELDRWSLELRSAGPGI